MKRIFDSLRYRGPSDPALRILRNRLLFINIVSLAIIVAVSLSVVYFAMFRSIQNEIGERLREIPPGVNENIQMWVDIREGANVRGVEQYSITDGEEAGDGSGVDLPVDYDKSFVANLLADGQIMIFSLMEISDSEYYNAVQAALARGNNLLVHPFGSGGSAHGSLLIRGETWNYMVTHATSDEQYRTSVVFLNTEAEIRRMNVLGAFLLLIGFGAVIMILCFSYFSANKAIAPVQASMDRQRRFVADASHELKTPLTVISMNAEAAKGAAAPDEISGNLENIEAEAARMEGLVKNLILLAKEGEQGPELSTFDLYEAIEEETDRVEAILFEKGIDCVFEKFVPQVSVHTDRERIKKVVSILLDNAVKYTRPGAYVKVTVFPATSKSRLRIAVENIGEYLPDDVIEHIFDRFYRADKSRNSATGGHGIGLAIAKETVQSLGKRITAESLLLPDGGAVNRFTIIF